MLTHEFEQRILDEAQYFIDNKSTIRATANAFEVSKSTIFLHLTKFLPYISLTLSISVNEILKKNKDEWHLRGGEATMQKFLKQKDK